MHFILCIKIRLHRHRSNIVTNILSHLGGGAGVIVASSGNPILYYTLFLLTSMTGVARVVAVVAGDPQNPVLDVVHPVGCHFGAAVHERSAAATGRRSLARQVRPLQGLQPNTRLVFTLQNTFGAFHCRSEPTEIRRERRLSPDHHARDLRGCINN